jgi:hypothetical protein
MPRGILNPIEHVGSRLRMRRFLLDMSQTDIADALGLTFQQVQKYKKGTNRIGATCGRNSAVGKRPRPERCNTGSRGPRWRMRRALYRCGTIARNCCDFPNHDPFRLTGRHAKFTGPEARPRQGWPGQTKGPQSPGL